MDIWQLNPEGLKSLWLKDSLIVGKRATPSQLQPRMCLQLRKNTENVSHDSRLAFDSRARLNNIETLSPNLKENETVNH
jgi:hypothetical protein